jgi:hypothetical protein
MGGRFMGIPYPKKKAPGPTLALLMLMCVCTLVKWTVLKECGDPVVVSESFPATRDIQMHWFNSAGQENT